VFSRARPGVLARYDTVVLMPAESATTGAACVQDSVRFVFGHRGHNDPEVWGLEQLLPARWALTAVVCARTRCASCAKRHHCLRQPLLGSLACAAWV
jgi:hypothetical protein